MSNPTVAQYTLTRLSQLGIDRDYKLRVPPVG